MICDDHKHKDKIHDSVNSQFYGRFNALIVANLKKEIPVNTGFYTASDVIVDRRDLTHYTGWGNIEWL